MDLEERAVREEGDVERRRRRQKARVGHLLDGLADAQHQRRVGERDDDVPVVRLVVGPPDRPDRRRPAGELGDGHLGDGDAVAEDTTRRPRTAPAERVDLGRALVGEVADVDVRDRREGLRLVEDEEVPRRRRGDEGRRDGRRGPRVVAELGVVDGGRDAVAVLAEALELEERVVPELRGRVEEAAPRDAERGGGEDRVEDAEPDVGHGAGRVRVERRLVQVAELGLEEEEERAARLAVRGGARDEEAALRGVPSTPRDGRADLGVALVLVRDLRGIPTDSGYGST